MDRTVKEEGTVSAPERVEIEQTARMYQEQQRMVSGGCHQSATWLPANQKARNELLRPLLLGGFQFLGYSP